MFDREMQKWRAEKRGRDNIPRRSINFPPFGEGDTTGKPRHLSTYKAKGAFATCLERERVNEQGLPVNKKRRTQLFVVLLLKGDNSLNSTGRDNIP